jgi:hypothetical protein
MPFPRLAVRAPAQACHTETVQRCGVGQFKGWPFALSRVAAVHERLREHRGTPTCVVERCECLQGGQVVSQVGQAIEHQRHHAQAHLSPPLRPLPVRLLLLCLWQVCLGLLIIPALSSTFQAPACVGPARGE